MITTAEEYARQAELHEAEGMDWSTTVPVDPSIWHEVLDQYSDLDNVVVDHEAAEATRRLAAREYANCLLNDPEWWRHLGNSEIG